MAASATALRNVLVPVVFGAVAPTILVGVWGVIFAAIWVPGSRYLWTSHQIKLRDLPVDVAWFFDAFGGLVIGIAISFAVARLIRGHFLRAWLLFSVSFVAAVIAETIVAAVMAPTSVAAEFELAGFFFRQPLVLFFALGSFAMFSLRARVQTQHNVP